MSSLYSIEGTTLRLHFENHRGQQRTWDSTARWIGMIAGSQGGKALAIDTPIPTSDGFKLLGDLQVGDCVFDENGNPCRVIRATEVMYGHTCYRVIFDDGAAIVADAEHQWLTQTYSERKNVYRRVQHPNMDFVKKRPQCQPKSYSGIRTTEDIRASLIDNHGGTNHAVALTEPVQYPAQLLPIPPYMLGAWLGDGTSSAAALTCADVEIVERIRAEGMPVGEGKARRNQGRALSYILGRSKDERTRDTLGRYISEGLKPLLRGLNLLDNKHIPECYKTASVSDRLALLQGLMDTDGHCKPNGRAEFTTINERLAIDVLELMRSLGLKPRLYEGRATLGGVDKGAKYRVQVTTSTPIFSLKRKRERQIGGYRRDLNNRYIVAVEPIQSVPVRCIQVDSPNALYLAGRDYIVTHNTSFGPPWLWREMMWRGAGDYIACTSSYDLFKLKMLPEIRGFFEHTLSIGRYWAGDKILEIADPETGQFKARRADDPMWARLILRSASAPGGLESATAKGAWLDEAGQDEFTVDAFEAITRRLTLHQGRMLITTTPYNLGWLKQQIIDKNGQDGIEIINFASDMNPSFPKEELDRQRSIMPEWKFNMFHLAKLTRPPGMIYNDFVDKYREQGGHKVEEFTLPIEWPRFVGVDPGAVNTAKIWMAHDTINDLYYVYRESLEGGKSTAEHATGARDLAAENRENVVMYFVGQRAETQQRMDWQAAGVYNVSEPPFHDVESGIDKIITLLKQHRIFFFDTCVGLLDEIGRYSRKLNAASEVTEEILNKETFHRLDALRYDVAGAVVVGDPWEAKII